MLLIRVSPSISKNDKEMRTDTILLLKTTNVRIKNVNYVNLLFNFCNCDKHDQKRDYYSHRRKSAMNDPDNHH